MNAGDDAKRLPAAIGDLVDLAFHAYARQFAFASLLSIAVFFAAGAAELALPDALNSDLRTLIMVFVEILCFGFAVGAISLGVAAHATGADLERATLLRAAAYRWPGVFGALIFVWAIMNVTSEAGALAPDADAASLILAPVTWLLWGAIAVAGPIAALSPELPVMSAFTSVWRSLTLSLRVVNLSRLAVVTFATVVPQLLEAMLWTEMKRRGIAHPAFWSSVPIDCLIAGPLVALQTVFALDFVRREAQLTPPPR